MPGMGKDDLQSFVKKKMAECERALAKHTEEGTTPLFKARLRVRLGSKLNSDEKELMWSFHGRPVAVRSRKDEPISSSNWLVLFADGFPDAAAAAEFGLSLQTALSVAAAMLGIGIDVGVENNATSSWGQVVKDHVWLETGAFMRDDVHGVDVYPDLPLTTIMFAEATASTTTNPDRLSSALSSCAIDLEGERIRSAAHLMNLAMLADHPAARLATFIAAVELISAGEKWSADQKAWIKNVRAQLADQAELSDDASAELDRAVAGLFNFGSLEKNRRLLRRLGLEELVPRWVELYTRRSRFLHGAAVTLTELTNMASEAHLLCWDIFKAYVNDGRALDQSDGGSQVNHR